MPNVHPLRNLYYQWLLGMKCSCAAADAVVAADAAVKGNTAADTWNCFWMILQLLYYCMKLLILLILVWFVENFVHND